MRNAAILLLAFLAGACVRVGHIQQTEPVRTTKFTGSHKDMAQCIQQRIGGRVQDESFGESYVIYGAVKGRASEGLTHYAITVRKTDTDEGLAEWRIMQPPRNVPTSQRYSAPPLSDAVVQQYWAPVQDCAARAKGSS